MKNFKLIETILWEDGNYFLPDSHMNRMEKSAAFFSFPFNRIGVERSLANSSSHFDKTLKYKVRLLLENSGSMDIESKTLEDNLDLPAKITFSDKKTDKADIFLYHKTTNRDCYNLEFSKYRDIGFFDVIFRNQEDEVTEGAITNILVRNGGEYLTPPLSCGVLPGTYRQYLLASQEVPLKEKILKLEDLLSADEIFLMNSVRKLVKATLAS